MNIQLVEEFLVLFLAYPFLFICYVHFGTSEWDVRLLGDFNTYLSVFGVLLLVNYLAKKKKWITGWSRLAIALLGAVASGLFYWLFQ